MSPRSGSELAGIHFGAGAIPSASWPLAASGWRFYETGRVRRTPRSRADFDRDGVPADPEVGACVDGGRMCGEVLADGHGEGVVQVRGDIHLGDTARHRPDQVGVGYAGGTVQNQWGRGRQRAGRV